MTTIANSAGRAFRAQRELLGLTQTELGERLDVHYTTIANWERDTPPRLATMAMCWLLRTHPGLKASVAASYAHQALR